MFLGYQKSYRVLEWKSAFGPEEAGSTLALGWQSGLTGCLLLKNQGGTRTSLPLCGPDALCIYSSACRCGQMVVQVPGTRVHQRPCTESQVHARAGPGLNPPFCLLEGQEEVPGHHPQLHGGARHRARHQHRAPAWLCQEPRHPERPRPAVPPQGNQGQYIVRKNIVFC